MNHVIMAKHMINLITSSTTDHCSFFLCNRLKEKMYHCQCQNKVWSTWQISKEKWQQIPFLLLKR